MNWQNFRSYFNLDRADSGFLRLFIVLIFAGLAYIIFKFAFSLTMTGIEGKINIAVKFSGWSFYIANLFPGGFFAICGVLIIWRLPETLKNLLK